MMYPTDETAPSWSAPLQAFGSVVSPPAAQGTMAAMAQHLDHQPPPGLRTERDVPFGPHVLQRMDVFRPADDRRTGALVFVHGGGFVAGDKREQAPFHDNVGWWAVRQGLVGITINYRLAPGHAWPAAIDDLDAALQVLRAQAGAWAIDPDDVTLMGHSAGAAHVAGWLARHADDAAVARAVLLSGIYDCTTMQPSPGRTAYFGADAELLRARSPAPSLPRSRATITLGVAEHDPPELLAQAEALRARWGGPGAPELLRLRWHNHFSTVLQLGGEPSGLDAHVGAASGRR